MLKAIGGEWLTSAWYFLSWTADGDAASLITKFFQVRSLGSRLVYHRRMSAAKSLWSVVQGDPVFMRRVNGWFAVFWIVMVPVSIAFGWLDKVEYVSALSIWALVSGHWSAWQAARVEVKQDQQENGVQDD